MLGRITRQLSGLFAPADYPDLIVGLSEPDDAAVWRIDGQRALILTADFFTPVVDNPYDWGAIAAANALSDVYAMRGRPLMALNLAALPKALPEEMTTAILRGAAEQVLAAGAVVAGGHTVDDDEPKFGLCVLGEVSLERIGTKKGARPGDVLLLTKPLGTGIIVTAAKADLAQAEHLAEAVQWMKQLNRSAAEALEGIAYHALTDVTGFSLLGHALEIAQQSAVQLEMRYSELPWMDGAVGYADDLLFPAAAGNNASAYGDLVAFDETLTYEARMLAFCPETSGGLLVSLAPDEAQRYRAALEALGLNAWQVAEVQAGEPGIRMRP
ncbi:MAG: selenide, water dikinase SelD [Chloroflexi bacterium]|nr:selenide, water dikinase SelD [Chloroflexota bacterium]